MHQGSNFIHGQFSPGDAGRKFKAVNPSTGAAYGEYPNDSVAVYHAVGSARKAFRDWRSRSRVYRADLFDQLAQLVKRDAGRLATTISVETGKSLNEANAEVVESLHMCQVAAAMGRQPYGEVFASELATKDAYVVRRPRGVVAVISPWNFGAAIGSFWSAAPALVEGNTVVHKCSELTPMVNQIIAELYREVGFPDGVYNLVHGDGFVGRLLVTEPDVDVILFTGSAAVAEEIKRHCAANPRKTCSVECGSKSAVIVCEDGNMKLAVEATVASAFKLSGQRCVSASRLLVQRSVFEEFKAAFLERASQITFGDPFSCPAPFAGPLISAEHREKVLSYNYCAAEDCDTTVLLSGNHALPEEGFFVGPFVYQCEWSDKIFLKDEVFGPHVALVPFDTLDDAVRIYNDTDFGLALGVISDDYRTHRQVVEQCTAGMIYLNGGSVAAESHLPFSSWKRSGWGSSAAGTWRAVTHTTAVTTNYEREKVSWAQGMK